jgi:hypothetical protein
VSQEPSEQEETSPDEGGVVSIPDDQLPEDLQPTEDNPLAQPVDEDVPVVSEGFGPAGSGGTSEDASESGNGDASDTSSSGASSEPADERG